MKLLNAAWATYQREVLHGATPEQVRSVRRAFFAGAHITCLLLDQIATLDAEAAREQLQALEGEMAVFHATLGTTLEARI